MTTAYLLKMSLFVEQAAEKSLPVWFIRAKGIDYFIDETRQSI